MFDRRKPPAAQPFVTHENIEAKVKWFDPEKGFGFASPVDGSGDVFLHISAIGPLDQQDLLPGATIVADLGEGRRGLQVVAVHEIDPSTATQTAAPAPRGGGFGARLHEGYIHAAPAGPFDGAVKFFNSDRGFGFIAPDKGGPDVFLHVSSLSRSGLQAPMDGQRVRFSIRAGRKGPEASNISFI